MLGYKYRANTEKEEKSEKLRDTNSLIKHEIYAPTFKALNDPFEFSIFEEIAKLRHEQERKDKVQDVNEILLDIHNYKDSLGVYSLSMCESGESCPTNELLWAHYANGHKGFCIEYDINKLKDAHMLLSEVNELNINYQLSPPTTKSLFQENKKDTKMLQKLFGTKSTAWKYENELRLLFDKSGKKTYHPSALKSVYFGLNMDKKERDSIIEGLDNVDVKFYMMEKINGTYKLKSTLILESKRKIENKLDNSIYKLLKTNHNPAVENFHILYTSTNIQIDVLQDFVSKFREEFSTKQSNISLYDDESIYDLIGKYPLFGKEKELIATHLIAYSSFDAPNFIWMYPDKE